MTNIIGEAIDSLRWMTGNGCATCTSLLEQNASLVDELHTTQLRNQAQKRTIADLEAMVEELRNELGVTRGSWKFYYDSYCELLKQDKGRARHG